MSQIAPQRWAELTEQQQSQVNQYIVGLLTPPTPDPAPDWVNKSGRDVLDRTVRGRVSYQLELIKCGKPNCKCASGELHGPYWYAYWRTGQRMACKYLGKEFKTFTPDVTKMGRTLKFTPDVTGQAEPGEPKRIV